ncbi:efflux RND transporter periplasmic adaptor subunit [Armatimonas sp.]|uniref:efflux RND transporter periplasmic adaptor subunit n=1 Tax=Armatimonas sp. TaxID=1872638 RepID=UPI00286C5470|nr:efflux RND transporter periplasmic adaptor subunit [Armatimonas sp.]
MKKRTLYCLLAILAGCTPQEAPQEGEPKATQERAPVGITLEGETLGLANLELATAVASDSTETLSVTGTLEADPAATAIVTSRVEGKIIRLTPNVGDAVASGAVVAVIESEKLHEAQLSYALAVKRLEAAKTDLTRRRKLAGLGAYGRPSVEEVRKQETEAQAALERSKSEARSADAALAEVQSKRTSQEAVVEQARTAERLATSQVEFAERQVARSERLLAEQLISRQEHEQALGERVKTGAGREHALAEIRAAQAKLGEVQASMESALTRREAAQKAVASASKQLTLAQQALARGEAIYKGGYLTSREVAEAEAVVEQARISTEGALDDVQLLGGQPGDNHSIPIHVPFAGRVLERKATLGQTVMAGESILTLVNPRTLFAQLALFPSELTRVKPGQPVMLKVAGRRIAGTIERLGELANEKTRTVKVLVRVDNPAGVLRPGLPVTATIGSPAKRSVLVPAGAVQTHKGKKVVFVPGEKPGEFKAQPVEVGVTQDGKTEIRSGLLPGAKFVAKNAFLVKSQAMKSELGE